MKNPYADLALEVCRNPQVVADLEDWFNSDQPRSAEPFGQELGRADEGNALAGVAARWLEEGRCEGLVRGYLRGLANRTGGLAPEWRDRLDRAADTQAGYAVRLTFAADATLAGFRRIVRLVDAPGFGPQILHNFGYPPWGDILGEQEKSETLSLLARLAERNLNQALWTGLRLIACWSDYGTKPLPEALWDSMLTLANGVVSLDIGVDASEWMVVPRLLARERPREVASLVVDALTGGWRQRVVIEEESLEVLKALARDHSQLVMEEIGKRMLDPKHRPFFGFVVLRGLFEAIRQPTVQAWIEAHGREYAPYIARHLESPGVDQEGQSIIPPLTLWVLTAFEDDDRTFHAFCAGRHNGVREGHARDHRPEIERQVRPFLSHPSRRVREWAQYELKSNEWETQWDDQRDDMWERV